ncbi:AAA family ATPase [Egicoccus sp. AB-alg2]|uniref:AAA family ATPase n=1 Tax=Egicoccus sp. AB-alg2 TaxID=3242693 RepID=UPI00359CD59C
MGGQEQGHRLVLITGVAGTGKSTLGEAAADLLGAAVLGWDWAMASLTRFEPIQRALRNGSREQYVELGWAIVCNFAVAQLRHRRSVVLDGVAGAAEIDMVAQVAADTDARLLVVATDCSDVDVHRARVEGRRREIPGWHELEWSLVAGARERWKTPRDADLYLDAVDPLARNITRLRDVLTKD